MMKFMEILKIYAYIAGLGFLTALVISSAWTLYFYNKMHKKMFSMDNEEA